MKVLFITSNRLGDAVLSTGLLDYIYSKYPDARITIACGPLAKSLFEGMPGLERVYVLRKKSFNRHWLYLWSKTNAQSWDMVVDLRNSAVSRLIKAPRKYIYGRHISKDLHKVEQNAAVMGLPNPPSPVIFASERQKDEADQFVKQGEKVIAIGPTANWAGKIWPAENFVRLISWLIDEAYLGPDIKFAVFAAPGEERQAHLVYDALDPSRSINVIAKTDPGTAAVILSRCEMYIGHDSGLMHCAAAAGIKTLGLFGPSYPHLYRPWGDNARYVTTPESFDELIDFEGYDSKTVGSLMTGLTVEKVQESLQDFIK
jgi:lipopolysaccharide export system permease protein